MKLLSTKYIYNEIRFNRLEGRMSHGIGTSFKDAYSHVHQKELIMGPGGLQLNFL